MGEYRKGSHSLYDLKVHVVWITKYRKPVLSGEVGQRLRDIVRRICADLDVEILAGNVRMDHVHLLVSVPPNLSVSKLVQKLKGVSSRRLLQSNKQLQREFWGRHLWARGYFAVSSGNVTDDVIAAYIKNQDEVERRKKSDNFSVGF
ncbi:MAG: IS200/IS605 family transposase [Rhodobacteraceae bacterium]|nr:IS200/IS605 family transposase [Paracoccaceae bacterium]